MLNTLREVIESAQATPITCIEKVPSSNLGQTLTITTEVLRGFPSLLQVTPDMVSYCDMYYPFTWAWIAQSV